MVIDRKYGGKVRDAKVFDQLCALAVENQPAAVETCGQYGMVLPNGAVVTHYHPQIIAWKSGSPRRDIFGKRVVLAIALCSRKGGKRRLQRSASPYCA